MKNWILITGASSGIGEAFAKRLARDSNNLVLVARSLEKLNQLADELKKQHSIEALVIQADLRDRSASRMIFNQTQSKKIFIHTLINNAGFGAVGDFSKIDRQWQLDMLDVNVYALTELTHLYLPAMLECQSGVILNVSSTASFQPVPYIATYAATKAFVTSLSESLWYECRKHGVQVLNFCPGRTKTNFGKVAGLKDNPRDWRPTQTSEEVVEMALKALQKNSPSLVTNPFDNTLRFISRFFSRKFVVTVAGKLAKQMRYQ